MRPTKAAEKPERGEESKVKPMPDLRIRVGSGKITGGARGAALFFSPAFLRLFLYFSYTFLRIKKRRKGKEKEKKRQEKTKKRPRKGKKSRGAVGFFFSWIFFF